MMGIVGSIHRKGYWLIQEWDPADVPTDPDALLRAYLEGRGRIIQNIITNVGIAEMAKRSLGLSSSSNNKILIGSSNTPTPQAAQTALTTQTGSVNVSSRTLEGTRSGTWPPSHQAAWAPIRTSANSDLLQMPY